MYEKSVWGLLIDGKNFKNHKEQYTYVKVSQNSQKFLNLSEVGG